MNQVMVIECSQFVGLIILVMVILLAESLYIYMQICIKFKID